MKKLLFVAILLTSVSNIYAFTTQGNWRWRKDDGSQTTATWLAAQNTTPVITSSSDVLRVRIELYNDPTNEDGGGLLTDAVFEDSSNIPGSTWKKITLAGVVGDPFVLAGSSPNVTDKEPTTQQLSSPHYITFAPGKVIVSSEKLPSSTIGDNNGTEYEYAIKPTIYMLPSTTYYFRVNAAEYPTGLIFPSITTAAVLPIGLSKFSVLGEGKKVKLEWTTESEQNNDRFEVQRSSNGTNWLTIANVKGKGTTSGVTNYSAYDNDPLPGVNYYRLQQYDLNGKFSASGIRSLKLDAVRSTVTVSPNPARSVINFKLHNEGVKNVLAVLSDAHGKVIYQQIFKEVQANTNNKLNFKQPGAGIYILKLKAEGLSESIKVVIQ